MRTDHCIEINNKKIHVFKIGQEQDIGNNPKNQHRFGRNSFFRSLRTIDMGNRRTNRKIKENRPQHNR